MHFNLKKVIYNKQTFNIIMSGEKLKALFTKSKQEKDIHLHFSTVLGDLLRGIRQKNKIIQIRKEEKMSHYLKMLDLKYRKPHKLYQK